MFGTWGSQWLLLATGEYPGGEQNAMTVAWGSFGFMWDKPLAMVVVRPTRHTYRLIERYDGFTLSAFAEEHREKLSYCGSHSGRNADKVKACGLTPITSREVKAPGFEEAELILECRKIYFDDFSPANFLADFIPSKYPARDYHRMYFGQVLAVSGTSKYRGSLA